MTKRAWLAALPVCLLAWSAPHAQSRRPLTPADIFALKTVGDPRIAPDGAWVAYTVSTLNEKDDTADTDIYMVPVGGGAPVRLTSSPKPETSPRWSPEAGLSRSSPRATGKRRRSTCSTAAAVTPSSSRT